MPDPESLPFTERVCPECNLVRQREEFPQTGKRRRGKVCVRCLGKPRQPKPCRGCGAPTQDFPLLANGMRSPNCRACYERTFGPKACTGCKQTLPRDQFHRYENGHWSRTCNACRRPEGLARACAKCKLVLPAHAFHRYKAFTRASCCHSCRVPRPNGPPGLQKAPKPCKVCGKEIWRDEAPSRLAKRVTCSEACENASRRRKDRTCLRCKRLLPFEAFDRHDVNRNRKGSCRQCLAEDTEDFRGDLVLRPSVGQLRKNLKMHAEKRSVKFGLTVSCVRKLHRSPCGLCGDAVSSVVLKEPEHGYMLPNCRGVCRLCRRLLRVANWGELIVTGNAIAVRNPLVSDLPGGCADADAPDRERQGAHAPP